jgi:hypothetical protein
MLPLFALASCTLGGGPYGSGIYGKGLYGKGAVAGGVCQTGPSAAREIWSPSLIVISTPSNTLSTFFLYRNTISQPNLVASSINGNSDQVPFAGTPLYPGELLIGEWVGGDFGVQATMTVTGTKNVPGNGNGAGVPPVRVRHIIEPVWRDYDEALYPGPGLIRQRPCLRASA